MTRDMDLIRDILLKIESIPTPGPHQQFSVEGCEQPKLHYHLGLLKEARLIRVIDISNLHDGRMFMPIDLTNDGHEFLDHVKDDGRWAKAKTFVVEKTGTLTIDALKAALSKFVIDRIMGS